MVICAIDPLPFSVACNGSIFSKVCDIARERKTWEQGCKLVYVLILYCKPCCLICFSERRPSRADLSILVAHNDDPTGGRDTQGYSVCQYDIQFILTDQMFVFFPEDPKVGIKIIKQLVDF